jgi:transposase-like protein
MPLRKVTKNRGSFLNDDSMLIRLFLALKNIEKKWVMPIRNLKLAINQLTIIFEERMPLICLAELFTQNLLQHQTKCSPGPT